jgi:serine/threonine-protein kinase
MAELGADLEALERGMTPKAVTDKVERAAAGAGPQTLTGVEARVSVGSGAHDIAIRKNHTPLYFGIGLAAALVVIGGAVMFTRGSAPEVAGADTAHKPDAPALPAENAPQPSAAAQPSPTVPATPTAPVPEKITIDSNPEHAEVFLEGSLVGNTPYQIEKPAAGKPQKLELRLPGYQSRSVEISEHSSNDVTLQLQKAEEPAPAATRPAAPSNNHPAANKRPRAEAPAKPARPAGRSQQQTEVLDPWN